MATLYSAKDRIPLELVELRMEIDRLPRALRDLLRPLCEHVTHYVRLQNNLVRIAQDAVDQLQLDVKYLTFDRDVTRHERDALREELENS